MASSAPIPRPAVGVAQNDISGPQSPSPARAAVDVAAVTSRDDFLVEFVAALGGQAAVIPVESVALAVDRLSDTRRPQILAIDTRDLGDVRTEVDAVLARVPHVSVLVFVPDGTEKEAAASFKGSRIFAVLTLPVEPRKTAAVFSGAVAESTEKLAAIKPAPAPSRRSAAPAAASEHSATAPESLVPVPAAASTGGAGRNLRPLIAGGVVLAVIAAGTLWYLGRSEAPAPAVETQASAVGATPDPVVAAMPAEETSLVQGNVDELLEKARLAMRERRFAEPSGDSALLYYRSAFRADAGNGEAKDGLARIASLLAGRLNEALAANRLDEAATTLAHLKGAAYDEALLSGYQLRLTTAQVSRALADNNPDRAEALVRAAQNAGAAPAAQLTKWRAEIARLQEQARQKRDAEQMARDAAAVEQKKLRDARAAAAATAEQQARATGEQQVLQEKLKAEQAARAAQDAAIARQAQAQAGARVLQGQLKHKRYVAPEFPQAALSKKVSGVVTVAFTVDTEGATREVRVESSNPPGVFDRAAIAAVKRWRYEPLQLNGEPAEVSTRMTIRFALPE